MNRRELLEAFDDMATEMYVELLENEDERTYYIKHQSYFDFVRDLLLMVHRARGNHEKIVEAKERAANDE